jgi:hypothetical protein
LNTSIPARSDMSARPPQFSGLGGDRAIGLFAPSDRGPVRPCRINAKPFANILINGMADQGDLRNQDTTEPLAKLPAEYGPRSWFSGNGVVSGSLSWLSLPIWSIFPGAKRINPAAVAASV